MLGFAQRIQWFLMFGGLFFGTAATAWGQTAQEEDGVAAPNAEMTRSTRTADELPPPDETAAADDGTGIESPTRDDIEVIVVTTERRQQNIQDVAGSVQAFSAEGLQAKGVGSDFRNLQLLVPGLHITNQEGQIEVFLRGIGSTNNDFSSDPAVATHYNGVYLARPRGIGPMFYDIERVEINKGPQGTLRGRNATSGTLNIISRRPDLDAVGGYLRSGVGAFSAREFEGALNLPILDGLAMRGAISHQAHDPYYSNALNNGVAAPGSEENTAFRVSALWEPSFANLTAHAVFDMSFQRGTGDPGQFWGRALSAGYDSGSVDDPRDQYFLQEGSMSNDIWGLSGVVTYDFGPVLIEYNGGVRAYKFFNKNAGRQFQNGVNYPGADTSGFNYDNHGTMYQLEESQAIVQELRVHSPDSAWLKWAAGTFYYHENFGRVSWDFLDNLNRAGGGPFEGKFHQDNLGGQSVNLPSSSVDSVAAYADATLDVTESVRVTAGLRVTHERKNEDGFQLQYGFDFPNQIADGDPRSGTPGFALKFPSQLEHRDPGSVDPETQLFDAIESFGERDNLEQLIADNPGSVSMNSSDPAGRVQNQYEATYLDGRVGLELDLTADNLLYGTLSTGTRSGGINPPVDLSDGSRVSPNFNPEKLFALEFGSKNKFTPGPVTVLANAGLIGYLYVDQVIQTLVSGEGGGSGIDEQQNFLTNTNAGQSMLIALELSGQSFFPYGFQLNWNLAWLYSRYNRAFVNDSRLFQGEDYIDYDNDGDTTEDLPQVLVNLEGGPLQNTPEWNAVLALGQTFALGEAVVDWTVNYTFRSKYYYSPFGGRGFNHRGERIRLRDMPRPFDFKDQSGRFLSDRVPPTHIFNVNAGVTFGEVPEIRVEAFVSNLTNETFVGKGFLNPWVNIRFLNPPRTFGARVTGTF